MSAKYLANLILNNPNNLKAILEIVKKYRLEKILPSTLSVLRSIKNREDNANKILVESVTEIDSDAKKAIENLIGKNVDEFKINKNLIAGYKAYTRDKVIDASLLNMLTKIV